jgi:hypothetical protein
VTLTGSLDRPPILAPRLRRYRVIDRVPKCQRIVLNRVCTWLRLPALIALSARAVIAAPTVPAQSTPQTPATLASDSVRIDYEAPGTCPAATSLHDAIRAQTKHFQLAQGEVWTRRFEISIRDEGEGFVGALTVHAQGAASERRELRARSCEEVVETFALILAVAIDPKVAQGSASSATARVEPTPPVENTAPAPTPSSNVRPVRRELATEQVPAPQAISGWTRLVGLGIEAQGAIAPQVAPTASAFFEIARQQSGSFGFAARITVFRSQAVTAVDDLGRELSFVWTAGRAEACLTALDEAAHFAIESSVGLEAGVLQAEAGDSVREGRSESRPWLSPIFSGRLQWIQAKPMLLELRAGVGLPLVRDEFRLLGPTRVVHKAPFLAGFAGFGLGVQF